MNFFLPFRPLLKGWLISGAGFGMVAFALSAQFLVTTEGPLVVALRSSARDWAPWIVLTPLLFRLTNRFPFGRRHWQSRLALHLGVCGLVIVLCHGWKEAIDPHFRAVPGGPRSAGRPPPPPAGPTPRDRSGSRVPRPMLDLVYLTTFQLPVYLMIICAAHASLYYRRDRERAASLTRARLDVLTAQLQPHFLFNTLNTIAELVHEDPNRADAMITALSEMLRLTLDAKAASLVPLEHEAAFIERYFAIMQMRFGERLRYRCQIDDAARAAVVPRFLLQPLVENAIRHGLDPRPEGGTVTIRAEITGDMLRIVVSDDGVGLRAKAESREGLGLNNTRARLEELFGDEASIAVREEGGVIVEVILPRRAV